MKRLIFILTAVILMNYSSFAQTNNDFNKYEFFVGYSHSLAGMRHSNYHGFAHHNGFNVSAVRNLSRYFGIKTDVSGVYNFSSATYDLLYGGNIKPTTVKFRNMLYIFLGGVQFKDNATEERLKPFAHAFLGVGHRRNGPRPSNLVWPAIIPIPNNHYNTGFVVALGGGLDVRLNSKLTIRAFQVDYNQVKYDDGYIRSSNSPRIDDLSFNPQIRIGTGVVF